MAGNNNAHPPVAPTDPELTPERAAPRLSADERVLYGIAWNHALAAQAEQPRVRLCEAEYTLDVGEDDLQGLGIVLRGSTVESPGWWTHLPHHQEAFARHHPNSAEAVEGAKAHPDARVQGSVQNRRPEAQSLDLLLQSMEHHKVGRPSTYHTVLHLMADKKLISWDKTSGQVRLTRAGLMAALTLREDAPEISGIAFVAHLDDMVDRVAAGAMDPRAAILDTVGLLYGETTAKALAGAVWNTLADILQAPDGADDGAGLLSGVPGRTDRSEP